MKTTIQLWTGLIVFQWITVSFAYDPKFDPTTRMRLVLVPADAAVGSVIYRLRASDDEFDYPLTFELVGKCDDNNNIIELLSMILFYHLLHDFRFFFIYFMISNRRCIIFNSSNRFIKMYKI